MEIIQLNKEIRETKSRLSIAENRISEIEDRLIEFIQSEQQKEIEKIKRMTGT